MAAIEYVWDGSAQDDSDATWNSSTISHLTLASALSSVNASGLIRVASDHQETQNSEMTLASANGAMGDKIHIVSVARATNLYQTMDSQGGYIDVGLTGGGSSYVINIQGNDVYIGCRFVTTGEIQHQDVSDRYPEFHSCKMEVDDRIYLGRGDQSCGYTLYDCDVEFTGNAYFLLEGVTFVMYGGTVSLAGSGTYNGSVFRGATSRPNFVRVSGVDIQDADSGDYLYNTLSAENQHDVEFRNCTVPSAMAGLITGTVAGANADYKFYNVTNSDTDTHMEEQFYEGTVNIDTGVYLDSPYSIKAVSNTTTKEWTTPLKVKMGPRYIDATGVTIDVELVTATALNNDDIALVVQYPDSTTASLGNFFNTKATNYTDTPTAITTSSKGAGDWTGEPGSPNFYKLTADFSTVANEDTGQYMFWIYLFRPSTTVYVEPYFTVS